MPAAQLEGRRIQVSGTVQGVGFRPWVYRVARQSGVTGRVHNDAAGVTIEAFGDATALEQFSSGCTSIRRLRRGSVGFQQSPTSRPSRRTDS